jgi:uncharacterized membrane protein
MPTLEERIELIESRLGRIEGLLVQRSAEQDAVIQAQRPEFGVDLGTTASRHSPPPSQPPANPAEFVHALGRAARGRFGPPDISITQVLGWTGATALVLATAYLIRLAVDSGWLTPERQLVIAVLSGFLLIGAGLRLRGADREYASLLPAGGLVVLFLSIYGAHLYYHFIGVGPAAGAVILTCLGALWLGRLFESELYSLFAVVGSYSAPFLLSALAGSVVDLVIYFSAWSMLFCVYAVWLGVRRVYLLAAYMALLGFHLIYGLNGLSAWGEAFAFQTIQFLVFLAGAIGFSVRHNRPMNRNEALVHLPLLLIFYALQYPLLEDNLSGLAPWISLASAALLLAAYLFAKSRMAATPESGGLLVSAYTALVLFHAGYMELIPHDFAPWAVLALLPAAALYPRLAGPGAAVAWPFQLLVGIVFAINYLRVVAEGGYYSGYPNQTDHPLLALFYAAELYAAYYFSKRLPNLGSLARPVLYAGHIALMGGAVNLLDERLAVSLVWGVIGLACLALAFRFRDKLLGKSSLLVFAASAAKVLLFDLSDATPLVRIACLAVLGVTLYVGGWMYRKVDAIDSEPA